VKPVAEGDRNTSCATLQDKVEIYEVVLRYCRGVDRADMDLVRSAYHPGAIDHHIGFDGSIDDFIQWLKDTISKYDSTTHIVGNHLASINGDRAVAETYGMGVHRVEQLDDPRNFTSGTRYVDRFERRSGRWAIVERWCVRDWARSDAGQSAPLGDGPRGSRSPDDPVLRALRWLDE